ncbi:MAG: amidoligase family protein, partial [Pseudobdellovibrionaceae bacterium]
MEFLLPPIIKTHLGHLRRVGFEIEFGGIAISQATAIIQQVCGGEIQQRHQYASKVVGTRYGDFVVESDSRLLSEKRYERYLEQLGIQPGSLLKDGVERIFDRLSGTLLPLEIAMPPLPINDLAPAEKIRLKLYEHSALGISSSIFAAFGMQINPEVPDFKPETLLAFIRSFFLLYNWLSEEADVAWARKISPYINPFPDEYRQLVLNPDYEPSLKRLMKDYLDFNPTRNRPLDLLPLFAFLDSELVFQYPVEKELIKARPTFHYRLPNSE